MRLNVINFIVITDNTQRIHTHTHTSGNGKHRTRRKEPVRDKHTSDMQFRTNLLLISSESVPNGNFRQENSPYASLYYRVCRCSNRTTLRQLIHRKLHVEFMKKWYPVSLSLSRMHNRPGLALFFFKQHLKLILHANRFLIAVLLIHF